jgi:hypothetical membrane protein
MSQSEKSRTDLRSVRIKDTRRAGALMISSGLIFIILNTVAESIYPNYSVRTNPLSDLGALGHSTTLLWDGQLFASGLLTLVAVVLLVFRSSLSDFLESKPIKLLYLLPPMGTLIVSLFPENSLLAVHSLGALIAFVFGAISAIYAYRFTKSPFRYFSVALGIISLVAIPFLGDTSLLGFGGIERLVVYPYTIWGIAFGAYLTAV